MKNLSHSALRCNSGSFGVHQLLYSVIRPAALFICPLLLIVFSSGCKKENLNTTLNEIQNAKTLAIKSEDIAADNSDGNVVNDYTGLSKATIWELKQARAATAKYQNIKNAIKDGYADIGVDVEGMGHHYMKSSIVDGTFNIREPELLVYNRNEDGKLELVAVEYAVPFAYGEPEGFSGTGDVWDNNAGVPLWFLHAWVWRYNPAGVFNPTNPLVHLR
ncbi:MAG: hypothetical protein ACR2KX_16235 [Chitinophagaceae bacterium]